MMWLRTCLLFCVLDISFTFPSFNTSESEANTGEGRSDTCQCGKANHATKDRIVGGTTTGKNEYPWMVLLMVKDGSGRFIPWCGGSIVSSKTIVTAAECTADIDVQNQDELLVVVGEHDLNKSDGETYVKVCHKEDYRYPKRDFYNFAVLTLCEHLTFSQEISPICLPSTYGPGYEYEDKDAIITGWGDLSYGVKASKLQEVTVKTMSNYECVKRMFGTHNVALDIIFMCASHPDKDTCDGDSGSPLMVEENSSYTLVGIVNAEYCTSKSPRTYLRSTVALNFIKSRMQGYICQQP